MHRLLLASCLLAGAGLSPPSPAMAQDRPATPEPIEPRGLAVGTAPASGPRLVWNPRWRRVSTFEIYATAGAGVVALLGAALPALPPHRSTGFLFDDDARDALRFGDRDKRQIARDASDVLLSILVTYPYLVDVLIVAAWAHRSPEVAREIGLVHTETIAITAAIQGIVNFVTGRQRPYVSECGADVPPESTDCTSSDRFRSFFSGHTSQAFAAAALTCTHHSHFALYDGWGDQAVCATGMVLAGATGLFRVMADMHYASDVIAAAGLGTLTGLLVPWLLHYRERSLDGPVSATRVTLVPIGLGAGLAGQF